MSDSSASRIADQAGKLPGHAPASPPASDRQRVVTFEETGDLLKGRTAGWFFVFWLYARVTTPIVIRAARLEAASPQRTEG